MDEIKDCIYRKEATKFIDKCLNHEEQLQSVERETLIAVKKYLDNIPAADVVEKKNVRQAFVEACQECRDACEEFDGFYADCNKCLLHGVKEKLKDVLEG